MKNKIISVITPCFNEEDGIIECYKAIKEIFNVSLKEYELEHIFCDDGSTDGTVKLLRDISANDSRIKIIINSRNFGIFKNTYNGVINSCGDAIFILMPVDLQDPPELIPIFVQHWEAGYEVVYGVRDKREEGALLVAARRLYYWAVRKLTYVNYPQNASDFQLIDKRVLEAMKGIRDAQPFMRLMTFYCGFKSIGVKYTLRRRKHGKSRNTTLNLFNQGLNGIISFSEAPIRAALVIGFLLSGSSMIYAIFILFLAVFGFLRGQDGIPTVITGLFFFGGVQLFFLGILGEYILAIFNQVRSTPLVIERERINFDQKIGS